MRLYIRANGCPKTVSLLITADISGFVSGAGLRTGSAEFKVRQVQPAPVEIAILPGLLPLTYKFKIARINGPSPLYWKPIARILEIANSKKPKPAKCGFWLSSLYWGETQKIGN